MNIHYLAAKLVGELRLHNLHKPRQHNKRRRKKSHSVQQRPFELLTRLILPSSEGKRFDSEIRGYLQAGCLGIVAEHRANLI